jgi:hypothetical protein
MSQAFSECDAKMMETEKVSGRLGSVHAQRLTAFSLQPEHLRVTIAQALKKPKDQLWIKMKAMGFEYMGIGR